MLLIKNILNILSYEADVEKIVICDTGAEKRTFNERREVGHTGWKRVQLTLHFLWNVHFTRTPLLFITNSQ